MLSDFLWEIKTMLAFWVPRVQSHNMKTMLVEEIRLTSSYGKSPVVIHYLQGLIHLRWLFGSSAINSIWIYLQVFLRTKCSKSRRSQLLPPLTTIAGKSSMTTCRHVFFVLDDVPLQCTNYFFGKELFLHTLPEINSSHLPERHPKRKRSSSNHPVSGAKMFVSERVNLLRI